MNFSKIFKSSIILFSAKALSLIANFYLNIILTKNLSTLEFGFYTYYMSILGLMAITSVPDINHAIVRFFNKSNIGFFGLNLALKKYFFGLVLFTLFFLPLSFIDDYYFNDIFIITVFIIFAQFFYNVNTLKSFLIVLEKTNTIAVLTLSISIINLLILGFFSNFNTSPSFLFFVFLLINFIILVLFSLKTFNKNSFKNNFSDYKNELIKYVKKNSFSTIIALITDHIDKLVVGIFFGAETLAVYYLGVNLSRQVFLLFKESLIVLIIKQKSGVLSKYYTYFFLIFSFFGLMLFLVTPYIIDFFYGDDYSDSSVFSQIIFLFSGVYIVSWLVSNDYLYNKKKKINILVFSNSFTSILQVLLILFTVNLQIDNNSKLIILAFLVGIRDLVKLTIIFILNRYDFISFFHKRY